MATARLSRRTRVGIGVGIAVLVAIAVVLTVVVVKGPSSATIASGTPAPRTSAPVTPSPATTSTVTPPGPTATPLVVYVGNSFVGGSSEDSGSQDRFPALVGDALHTDWQTITSGGSGYVDPGDDGLRFDDLAEQVPANASLVVIVGSDDDAGYPYEKIMDAALTTLQTIKQRAPNAAILVVSTPWVSASVPDGIQTSRNAVRDAAAMDALPYVDPIADGWWFTGPPEQIGDDGLHPTDLGHAQAAEHLEPIIQQLLDR
ncbi:GDSL-type esterase/lipase family protein [Subtercola endophyticus]|uniref:GDSL-type esterase/lipase family protein n=1 Tax=Subtercola endophyticus TaxID=2895559 RepID=UPI001E5E4C6B|nr:GDSL-type esterase/lipase family protein [Subtercola endophyticus]UFS59239.1 GDSL-type esterase/lipase family protein [Subtercola endophyticus]